MAIEISRQVEEFEDNCGQLTLYPSKNIEECGARDQECDKE